MDTQRCEDGELSHITKRGRKAAEKSQHAPSASNTCFVALEGPPFSTLAAMACSTVQCCERHPKACSADHRPQPTRIISSEIARAESEEGARRLRALAEWPRGDLAVSHTNAANVPFARNWWLHLQAAGVQNFALLATDDMGYAMLSAALPAHAVRCPRSIVGTSSKDRQPSRYRSAAWTKLMFAVPLMVRWVLRLGLNVLWMDTDVVALANPFPSIRAQLDEADQSGGGGSRGLILASVDGRVPEEDLHECRSAYTADARWGRSASGWKLCGGLFYLRHGDAALGFLREWERRLRAPAAGAKNQPHYNEALRAFGCSATADPQACSNRLSVRILPCDLFPNGYRYASEAWRHAQRRKPLAVHNNCARPQREESNARELHAMAPLLDGTHPRSTPPIPCWAFLTERVAL